MKADCPTGSGGINFITPSGTPLPEQIGGCADLTLQIEFVHNQREDYDICLHGFQSNPVLFF